MVCYTSSGTLTKKEKGIIEKQVLNAFIKKPHIHPNTWSMPWMSMISNALIHFYSMNCVKKIINNQQLQIVDELTKLYNQSIK